MAKILIALIRLYQIALSPYFGTQCRFSPTCSHYGIAAIRKHGALRGFAYTIRRLARCHPWHPGGIDPVP
ncbi:membrane protein insertion efficiency factor YidD [Pseudomethylobacillus aquaticus]|uniref:Putative membrane protein insertion efficiency factor n=1 Tax=Pseudomethylobacillus aquaticus TaxID=2676064 RepID=A0A3N0V2M6_9PROT|nr:MULTISPECIES: membrane protein insertion efficiency factor YidD [Methylophilaceae]ROH86852.1 membrane protein insertion efficiency factor YidD [Pseudomethylobacillus aquaticus]